MKAKATDTTRPVVVTTAHRGVFFGNLIGPSDGPTVKLSKGRNCLYWSKDVGGFVGLATKGPTSGCRVGPAADLELRNVTSVVECSPEAVAAWEKAPWA